MIKISEQLQKLLENDDDAYFSFQRGVLNLSAYARLIKKDLELATKKNVNLQSIIVGLSRLKSALKPAKKRQSLTGWNLNISLHSHLAELTYEKTATNLAILREIYQLLHSGRETYLVATQGLGEITIIGDQDALSVLQKHFKNSKPIYAKENLTGVTIKFPKEFINIPNALFALYKRLAVKQINIIEIISTFSEITFIVEKKDALLAISQLERQF